MASTVYDGYPYVFLIEFFYLFVDWNMMLYQVTHELHHDSNFSLFYSVSNKDMIISFFFLLLLLLQISRLIYTNSGNAILALASNAIHLLWKWQRSDRNASGKVKALAKRF